MRLTLLLLAFILLALAPTEADAVDNPAIHGMLVVGRNALYLSHLPMFHAPHDYQVIFEAEASPELRKAYQDDLKLHPEQRLYTLEPQEKFVLPEMVQAPRPFAAKIYRGHFERGGTALETGKIEIKKIIFYKQFDGSAIKPKVASYLFFGRGSDLFLAHLITATPDFDQVLSVSVEKSAALKRLDEQNFVRLTIPSSPNEKPRPESKSVTAALEDAPALQIKLRDLRQHYLEFDDLAQE